MTSFYARFHEAAERFHDRTAIEVQRRQGVERFTYARLRSMAGAAAAFLAAQGVRPGSRCALLAENDALWCAAYLGILRVGAVAVPFDTSYKSVQIARLLADSGASLILASPRFLDEVERAQRGLERPCPSFVLAREDGSPAANVVDLEREATESGAIAAPSAATVKPDDPAVILYTSGTTSNPKGVVLTQGNLLGEIDLVSRVVSLDADDAVLGVLPLFHALAQMANLLLPLSIGSRVVFLETVNTSELLRALQEREISAFCCVPQFFYLVHERLLEQIGRASRSRRLAFRLLLWASGTLRERTGVNLGPKLFSQIHSALGRRMRLLVTGGSRFDPRIGRDFYRLGFNILQAYGLTETSGAATVLRPGDKHVGSVGHALPGVDLKIVPCQVTEEASEDQDRKDARVGEIAIRGPIVSPGYYQRPDANAATFRDGWLHTGDLGYIDRNGRLHVTGRAKEMIVLGSGKNIYPEEIEAHYLQSPSIKELCVMGRANPGRPATERLHAVIVPDFDSLRERKILNSREILRFEIEDLSAQVPSHKRILSYDIVTEDLPRTTTRKLKRFEIERKLRQLGQADHGGVAEPPRADSAQDEDWAADPHVARALEVVRNAARVTDVGRPSANLELDLGLDSMERVELIAALEARFAVSVPDDVAHGIHTLRELVEAVRPAGGASTGDAVEDFDPWGHLLDAASDDDQEIAGALASRPFLTALLFVVAKSLYALAWLLLGLRVSGRENLPQRGPFLISPNHQSFLDAFILVGTLPYRVFAKVFYVGASEYFATRLRAWIARTIRIIPVDPDSNLVRAMRAGSYGLRREMILILFPEGERSIDGEIRTFKKGAAILSLNVGAPIVPVALDGLFEVWPRARGLRLWKLLPFSGTRVRVRFEKSLVPAGGELRTERDYASLTEQLRLSISQSLSR